VSKPKAPPLSDQMLKEAADWFVEFRADEVAQADRESFVQWLKVSPEHIRAYLQVTAHWEEAGAPPATSVPSIAELTALAREPAAANVIPIAGIKPREDAKAAEPVAQKREESILPRAASPHRLRRRLAAGVVIALVGAGAAYRFEQQRGVYATDIGEQRSIRLNDGSTVDLNAHSKVRVRLRAKERDVELIQGQALFRVAKDLSRPFIVRSEDTNVLAVGTQFDVNRHRSRTIVTVIEGRVAVFPASAAGQAWEPALRPQLETRRDQPIADAPAATADKLAGAGAPPAVAIAPRANSAASGKIFLTAGEQLTVSNAKVSVAPKADVAAAIAWTQKQIVFNATPLSDVVDEFNRYNVRQLLITDPSIADMRISGEFSSTNPDSLLKGLDGLNRFRIRETSERIEIAAK